MKSILCGLTCHRKDGISCAQFVSINTIIATSVQLSINCGRNRGMRILSLRKIIFSSKIYWKTTEKVFTEKLNVFSVIIQQNWSNIQQFFLMVKISC